MTQPPPAEIVPVDPAWAEYAASRLSTPIVLFAVYGMLSLWSELALLTECVTGLFSGLQPLLHGDIASAFLDAGWSLMGIAAHLLGVGAAITSLTTATLLQGRRRLDLARLGSVAVAFAAVVLPVADLLSVSCCALVPATVFGTIGVFGGILATLALADNGVREGFEGRGEAG